MNGMSPRESFNVLKKGAPRDLSIYFLKENMIYSLSWSAVGQNMETGWRRTFRRSLYLIISLSLLSCTAQRVSCTSFGEIQYVLSDDCALRHFKDDHHHVIFIFTVQHCNTLSLRSRAPPHTSQDLTMLLAVAGSL